MFLSHSSLFHHCGCISLLLFPISLSRSKIQQEWVSSPLSPFGDGPARGTSGGGRSARGCSGTARNAAAAARGSSASASRDAEPGEVGGLVHGNRVANVEGRVTDELGAVAVDHLRVARLRGVGVVLGEAHV